MLGYTKERATEVEILLKETPDTIMIVAVVVSALNASHVRWYRKASGYVI